VYKERGDFSGESTEDTPLNRMT